MNRFVHWDTNHWDWKTNQQFFLWLLKICGCVQRTFIKISHYTIHWTRNAFWYRVCDIWTALVAWAFGIVMRAQDKKTSPRCKSVLPGFQCNPIQSFFGLESLSDKFSITARQVRFNDCAHLQFYAHTYNFTTLKGTWTRLGPILGRKGREDRPGYQRM